MSQLKQSILAGLVKLIQTLGPRKVQVLNRKFKCSSNVFNPKFFYTSRFFAEILNSQLKESDEVLDVGTGSGILAIVAADKARKVVALDINAEAVACARVNAQLNKVDAKVEACQSDLFSALKNDERFNVILFNPPYFKGQIKSVFDRALYDPGKKMIARFFSEAKKHLVDSGYILMLYSSAAEPEKMLAWATEQGWHARELKVKKLWSETLIIYQFTL